LGDSKGIVHPKKKIMSLFTHPHAVPNLYDFYSAGHKRRIFKEWKSYNESQWAPASKTTLDPSLYGQIFSKYHLLCPL